MSSTQSPSRIHSAIVALILCDVMPNSNMRHGGGEMKGIFKSCMHLSPPVQVDSDRRERDDMERHRRHRPSVREKEQTSAFNDSLIAPIHSHKYTRDTVHDGQHGFS